MIIGISGKQRSGKDTLAASLIQEFGGDRIAFADKMKLICGMLWGSLPRQAARPYWVAFGGSVRQIDPLTWVRVWFEAVMAECGSSVITSRERHVWVPDVRYRNECAFIKTLGGRVLRLEVGREAQEARGANLEFEFAESECDLDAEQTFDFCLDGENPPWDVFARARDFLRYEVGIEAGEDADSRRDPEAFAAVVV